MDEIKRDLENSMKKLNLQEIKVSVVDIENCNFGFIGKIINARIEHKKGIINVKVKIAPKNVIYRNQLLAKASYANEIYFYTKIQESFKNFQQEKLNSWEVFEAWPKYYGSGVENEKEYVILEDLHEVGFVNRQRHKQITDSELKLVLLNYAKFHAISISLKDQKRDVFDEICKDVFKNLDNFNIISNQINCVKKQALKIEPILKMMGVNGKVLRALRSFAETRVVTALANFDVYRDDMCCIIHGDAWTNNIMIKYDEDIPKDLRIIDFQAVRLGSLIEDLSYFIFTSCDKKQLKNLDNYLMYYHEILSKSLINLGSNPIIFTYENLLNHWEKHCHYGLSLSIAVLHGLSLAVKEIPNPEQVLEEGEYIFDAFNRESVNEQIYLEKVRDVLEFSKERNFI